MKNTLSAAIPLLVIVILLSGCGSVNSLMSLAPTAAPGSILFQDDFSDPTSGWATINQADQTIQYDLGRFHFHLGQPNYADWSTPRLKFEDARISVDVTKNSGPDNNDYGIICRYQDEANYYSFLISSDGYYGISKMKDGSHGIIGTSGMLFDQRIQKGNTTNHLEVDCIGRNLALWVNGYIMIETQDPDFTTGDVGLIAGTFDEPGLDLSFDNYMVVKP